MKENKIADLSMDFAVKIIKLCETTKGLTLLSKQAVNTFCKTAKITLT